MTAHNKLDYQRLALALHLPPTTGKAVLQLARNRWTQGDASPWARQATEARRGVLVAYIRKGDTQAYLHALACLWCFAVAEEDGDVDGALARVEGWLWGGAG